MEKVDSYAPARNLINKIAQQAEIYCGIPMPLEGEDLIVDPQYPHAALLAALCKSDETKDVTCDAETKEVRVKDAEPIKIRNMFWSHAKRSDVVVFEREDGKCEHGLVPGANHLKYDLRTYGCSVAWGVHQESRAMQLLGTLIGHHPFKGYLLTGMFLEHSKRSDVMYMFRRLKPTVAIRMPKNPNEECSILTALCMHPIAYYRASWAGAMCPTDDVIAHLQLMRADEKMFWRRCSQHAAYRPEAGV